MATKDSFDRPIGCCPSPTSGLTRRGFFGGVGAALGGSALAGLSWTTVRAGVPEAGTIVPRSPLTVKPILVYEIPKKREQTSWRSWGGIQTEEQARQEIARIEQELKLLGGKADFPIRFLPVTGIKKAEDLAGIADLGQAQSVLVYAAGGSKQVYDKIGQTGKDAVWFVRHKSGPVYLWYEIISPRYLRQHKDELAVTGVDFEDVVVDSQDDILWRLRALAGLHNTRNTRILTVGGASAWAQPEGVVPDLVRKVWKMEFIDLPYDELGKLIEEARKDQAAMERARKDASAYLRSSGTRLETKTEYVENAFLLSQVFQAVMRRADCRAITINSCMGTIMPIAQTTACLVLSLLNDDGYLAFCESDFVVIPSGILLANISGKPVFLNDPTYPHHGLITLAHCTAPGGTTGRPWTRPGS